MVNIGDVVLVTIPTFWPGVFDVGLGDPSYKLQQRLQTAGLNVISLDASGLPYFNVAPFGQRGQLLVKVSPNSYGFGNVQDLANLVAGAAYAEGFDINAGASAYFTGYANPQPGQPRATNDIANQNKPDLNQNQGKSVWDEIAKTLNISTATAQLGAIGLVTLVAFIALAPRGR